MFPKMSTYRWDFHEIKYLKIKLKNDELLMKSGIKSALLLKNELIVNLFTMKNI